MPSIVLNDYAVGLMTQPSDTDVPDSAMVTAENVDLDYAGKKRKQKGLAVDLALPAGLTLKSFTKYRWVLPDPIGTQTTTIVYGQDAGGRDELWWRPYWNPTTEAWVDAWQELTEFEGPLTADATTSTTQIVDAALAQVAASDYYNDWTILNVTRQTITHVSDHATDTLTMLQAVPSQASGDTYFLYRFPLSLPLEGIYTSDVATTTTLTDTQLRAQVDDYYVGWTVYNVTRSASAVVTDYDASAKKLTHPTIASQTTADTYYIYRTDHDIGVESGEVVRFFPRNDSLEMSVGSDQEYPKIAPLWFGYIDRTFYDLPAGAGFNTKWTNFWLTRNIIEKAAPVPASHLVVVDHGSLTLAVDTWHFKMSLVYDGYQEGPLSEDTSLTNTNAIRITLRMVYGITNVTYNSTHFGALHDKRITHMRVYAAKGDSDAANDQYFMLVEWPIDLVVKGYSAWIYSGVYFTHSLSGTSLILTDTVWAGTSYESYFEDQITFGKFKRWDINQGHTSERVDVNYKFRALLDEQNFLAPIFSDQRRDAYVGYSVQSNDNGVPVDDVIPHQNYLALNRYGISKITGLADISGYLIVLTPEKIFKYAPERFLVDFPQEHGAIAENGFLEAGGVLYFVGIDDFYAYDGARVIGLMDGRVKDQWDAISSSNKESAIVGYSALTKTVWIKVASTVFVYSVRRGHWKVNVPGLTFVWFASGPDGELYAATATSTYLLESSAATTALTMKTKSKVIDFTKEINGRQVPVGAYVQNLVVKHTGASRLVYRVYDPSDSTVYPKRTIKFYPNANGKPDVAELNVELNQVQIEMEEEGTPSATSEHEVDYEILEWFPAKQ